MLEQAALRERVQELLDQERQAADAYAQLASKADDSNLRQQLEQLHRDKLRHVKLAQRLLEILE